MKERRYYTAPCRFCGQIVQFDSENALSEEQQIDEATLHCACDEAITQSRRKRKKDRTLKNVEELFGEENKKTLTLLNYAAECICDDDIEKITLNLYNGIKATISQNSKGEIKVERTDTIKKSLTK